MGTGEKDPRKDGGSRDVGRITADAEEWVASPSAGPPIGRVTTTSTRLPPLSVVVLVQRSHPSPPRKRAPGARWRWRLSAEDLLTGAGQAPPSVTRRGQGRPAGSARAGRPRR